MKSVVKKVITRATPGRSLVYVTFLHVRFCTVFSTLIRAGVTVQGSGILCICKLVSKLGLRSEKKHNAILHKVFRSLENLNAI